MKERFQNPNCGDQIRLRLFSFNSNQKKNVFSIEKVEIIYLDENEKTEQNPTGEVLYKTINQNLIQNPSEGEYYIEFTINENDSGDPFIIGKYIDRWYIQFENNETCTKNQINNFFEVYPSIWFTSSGPNIYDFDFKFKPNKITKGSKRYIVAEIRPITPAIDSIKQYYNSIAITGNLKINIQKSCSNCPEEENELIIEDQLIEFREQNLGYYLLDTEEMEEGTYDIWFRLEHGELVYISEKNQLSIY